MKKYLCGILSLALCGAMLLGGCNLTGFFGDSSGSESVGQTSTPGDSIESGITESDESEGGSYASTPEDSDSTSKTSGEPIVDSTEEEDEIIPVYDAELVDYFYGMSNGKTLYVDRKATVETTALSQGTFIGEEKQGEIVIDGGNNGTTLTATGQGVGAIQAKKNTTLVFRNLTIRDTSATNLGDRAFRRDGYLEFGGNIRFENCMFDCAVYLCDDANVRFDSCKFDSGAENMYAMWIADGSASFTKCEFTGWRAVKLYEGSDNKYESVQDFFDVENVVFVGCTFKNLKKKPGIAIDVFQGEETSLTISRCVFEGCQQWTKDSYEGLLSVYESDVDTSTITLVIEDVTADGWEVDWETDREFGNGAPNA